jgi:hypothetical protein
MTRIVLRISGKPQVLNTAQIALLSLTLADILGYTLRRIEGN